MNLKIFSLIICFLSVINCAILYGYQVKSGMWLPRTEEGKWRQGSRSGWINRTQNKMAIEVYQGKTYDDLNDAEKKYIHSSVVNKMEDDSEYKRMMVNNSMVNYISNFGLFQFPLSIILIICSISGFIYNKQSIRFNLVILLFSVIIFGDAFYRSYFSSLGW